MPQLVKQEMPSTLLTGAVEGKTILVHCSGCDKPLIYVWANNPDLEVDFKVLAECCYCEDKSFPVDIHGGFAIRGYHKEEKDIVNVTNQCEVGGQVIVSTEKVD